MATFGGIQVLLCVVTLWAASVRAQPYVPTTWTSGAHATFYGGKDGSGTMNGACGYGNLNNQGYGTNTAALSNALFNNGLSCGACFELECIASQSQWCYGGGKTLTVTATNNCPHGSFGSWCDYPKIHFDLAYAAFTQLAKEIGGVIPVQYRRVACLKKGGIRFTLNGNPNFFSVLVFNVGGPGDVHALTVKGSKFGSFQPVNHNWGQVWTLGTNFVGQSLSFGVTVGDGTYKKTSTFLNVVSSNWQFGQTHEANHNF